MGRKRAIETPPAEADMTAPETPQAAPEARQEAAPERKETRRGDKTEAVKDALSRGIESPTEIAADLARQGIEISTAHVSTIKGGLKRKGFDPKAKKRGRPKKESNGEGAAQPPRKVATTGGLTSQDLSSLADLAERAGGVTRLLEFLSALGRVR